MKNSVKLPFLVGAIFAATAVIFGAFGAHGLKPLLSASQLNSYHTGVEYQMYHAIGLFLVGFLSFNTKLHLKPITWLFLVGTLLFSGSIYLLNLGPIWTGSPWRWLGPITPIGGLLLIVGWTWLAVSIARSKVEQSH